MINLENLLNEAMPALIPEYPVNIAGQSMTLRFDVNVNKTKKGIKLQFVMANVPTDPREIQQLTNEIGAELQEKFGNKNLQIINDLENPYKNVIGFLIPLPSIANFVMKHVMETGDEQQAQDSEVAPGDEVSQDFKGEELPSQELPPAEEKPQAIRERMKKIAGI